MKVCKHCGMAENGVCVRHNPVEQVDEDSAEYKLGFRHGSDSEVPNTFGIIFRREEYFAGYIAGVEKRDERMAGGKGHVIIPEWMTKAQVEAVNTLYRRSPDGAADRWEFFTRIQECGIGSDRYAGINWCNMFVGIEPDGYTHT